MDRQLQLAAAKASPTDCLDLPQHAQDFSLISGERPLSASFVIKNLKLDGGSLPQAGPRHLLRIIGS